MGKSTVWKLTTALFAATTVILLLREPAARAPLPERPDEEAAATTPRAEPPPRPVPGPEDGPGDAGEEPPLAESAELDPAAMSEDPRSLARRILFEPDGGNRRVSQSEWALLQARRKEVMPVLEDWIRRRDDLREVGVWSQRVFDAYARVGGEEALPLLRDLLLARTPPVEDAWRALRGRLEDPQVLEILRLYQRSLEPGWVAESPIRLYEVGGSARALVHEWAENPPPGHPRVRIDAREALFLRGTADDREKIWRTREGFPEEEFLWTKIDPDWPEPWPSRLREEALSRLDSDDPWTRLRGMNRVVQTPGLFPPETLASVEARLREDLEVERPEGVDDPGHYRRVIESNLEKLEARRRSAARAEKVEEALRAR